jgi:hypothetical protein
VTLGGFAARTQATLGVLRPLGYKPRLGRLGPTLAEVLHEATWPVINGRCIFEESAAVRLRARLTRKVKGNILKTSMPKQQILLTALLFGFLAALFYVPLIGNILTALVAGVVAWEWGALAGLSRWGRIFFGGFMLALCLLFIIVFTLPILIMILNFFIPTSGVAV